MLRGNVPMMKKIAADGLDTFHFYSSLGLGEEIYAVSPKFRLERATAGTQCRGMISGPTLIKETEINLRRGHPGGTR